MRVLSGECASPVYNPLTTVQSPERSQDAPKFVRTMTPYFVPNPNSTGDSTDSYIQVESLRSRHEEEIRPSTTSFASGPFIDLRSRRTVPPKLVDCIRRTMEDKIGQDLVKALEQSEQSKVNGLTTPTIWSQLKAAHLLSSGSQTESGQGHVHNGLQEPPSRLRCESPNDDGMWSHRLVRVATDGGATVMGRRSRIQTDSASQFTQNPPPTTAVMPKRRNVDTYESTGRSQILIINNKFDNHPADHGGIANHRLRSGAEADVKNLQKLFLDVLQYKLDQITCVENVKSTELDTILNQFKVKCEGSQSESLIVVVMSHGSAEPDSLLMDDLVSIHIQRDLVYKFNHVHFPYFVDKPKIFLFEACRPHTFPSFSFRQPILLEPSEMTDVLVGQSTVPFSNSYRHNKEGSLYVRAIVEIFTKNHTQYDIRTMLEMCTKKVIEYVGSYQETSVMKLQAQIPTLQTIGFVKRFYFQRNNHRQDSESEYYDNFL